MNNRALTDDEIREILIERKKAERHAQHEDRILTIKIALGIAVAFAGIASMWSWSWILYGLSM